VRVINKLCGRRLKTKLMKNKIAYLRLFAGLISALLIVPVNSKAQTNETVRIAIASYSLAFLVPFVAKDRGLYAKHGIEAEIIQVRPNVAMAALLSGDIDYVELIGSIIRSAGRGAPVRAIDEHQSTLLQLRRAQQIQDD